MTRQIIYRVVEYVPKSYGPITVDIGYFAQEKDAQEELVIQTKRITEALHFKGVPPATYRLDNNGHIGTIILASGREHKRIAIHPIMLR